MKIKTRLIITLSSLCSALLFLGVVSIVSVNLLKNQDAIWALRPQQTKPSLTWLRHRALCVSDCALPKRELIGARSAANLLVLTKLFPI